jgi:hypothetical protein
MTKVSDFVQIGTAINSGVTIEEGAFIGSGVIVWAVLPWVKCPYQSWFGIVKDVAKIRRSSGIPHKV